MANDAFVANVKPGGLRSNSDIKILICYILFSIKDGINKEDLIDAIQEDNIANYFEISSAFSDLLENNNIYKIENSNKPELYTVTENGKMIANQLDVTLPLSVREQAITCAMSLLAKRRIENENIVKINKIDNGYNVECHISDGVMDLMNFTLYVPDKMQADLVKKNFHKNPGLFYNIMLALSTNNKAVINDIIKNI